MEIATLILSGLALLAATAALILVLNDKKRSKKRNAALIDYVDNTLGEMQAGILEEVREMIEAHHPRFDDELKEKLADVAKEATEMLAKGYMERVEKLEKGIIPDYEAAKQAAEATNEFHKGIANILNYNEMDALRRMREVEMSGSEVD